MTEAKIDDVLLLVGTRVTNRDDVLLGRVRSALFGALQVETSIGGIFFLDLHPDSLVSEFGHWKAVANLGAL